MTTSEHIFFFHKSPNKDIAKVGGKNASLGEI